MKLVYLIAGTFNAGGMERVLSNKANWFAARGYEVVIVTTDQRGRVPYFSLHPDIHTYDLGINYDETNGRSFLRKAVAFTWKQWRHLRRLTALLQKLKADVVVCMFNNDVSFVYKIHDASRKILEAHFSKHKKLQYCRRGFWRLADCWRTWREERIVRHYDRFVVLTGEDKELWGNMPNICVIPNARTFNSEQKAELTQKRVLAIGRLDYQKGFDRLIEIWGKVQGALRFAQAQAEQGGQEVQGVQRVQGWQLNIVGDGLLREELQRQIERLGLQDTVHILPPTSDIKSVYLRSSILVMTSRYEGLPMVLIEAQTYGLPIVAYACPCGPRDIINDGVDGFLIPDDDEVCFAERLTTLMSDNVLRYRMGAEAMKASERFNEERIMQQWESILK